MDNPHTALASALQAIDDQPSRSENLTNLVHVLSPWERRQVRLQLGASASDGLATFEDLPVDIICLIPRHLHIEDVLACCGVSRRCRAAWTEPSVATGLCQRFFPALQTPYTFSAFRRACRTYLRRRSGKFTSTLETSMPYRKFALTTRDSMTSWDRESRETIRPDPALHPDGEYPRGWLDTSSSSFVCYGGGNVVWIAYPSFLVIDNLYTSMRRVVKIPGGDRPIPPHKWKAVASRSLVALQADSDNYLLVHNIEANQGSHCLLPSHVSSMAVQDRRLYVVLDGNHICIFDHDGSKVVDKDNFNVADGPHEDHEFSSESGPTVVYPHLDLRDRFFTATMGYWFGPALPGTQPVVTPPTDHMSYQYLIVREFDESASRVAHHYQDPGKLKASGMFSGVSFGYGADGEEAAFLDGQGSYDSGHWDVHGSDAEAMAAAGLPPLPDGFDMYHFYTSFNAITKTFSIQRHLESIGDGAGGTPWNQQLLTAMVPRPGILRLHLSDADDADFSPTRVSGSEIILGELELRGLEERMITYESYRVYQDEDFAVLFMKEFNRIFVWSFVDEDEEGGGETGSRP